MSFTDDLKDKFQNLFSSLWARIQESSAYHQARDRYENMTSIQQKAVIFGFFAITISAIFYVPWVYYSSSSAYIEEFEARRDLIREMLKVTKSASETPQIPQPPSGDQIRMQIDNFVKSSNLLPEQIKEISEQEPNSKLIPKNLSQSAVQVRLSKLNLRQIIALGSQFQSISPSLKMQDLKIEANRDDNHYLDLVVNLISLKVPNPPKIEVELPSGKGGARPSKGPVPNLKNAPNKEE